MLRRLCLLFLLFTCGAQAASVWKVTKNEHSIYIGGTLHILSPDDFPLPDAYAEAYRNADKLVFETDIAGLNSPQFQQDSLKLLTYQDGTTLSNVLSEDTYLALKQHLASRNIDINQFATYTPALVGITLSMTELRLMGLTSQGVDEFYYFKAMMDQKKLDWFESPVEQLAFISALGGDDEDQMIQYALEDVRQLPESIGELKALWRSGDMDTLYQKQASEFRQNFPQIYEQLLVQRNKNWLPVIKTMFETAETEFVLVGTMHLSGQDSVLDMLKREGYSISKL